ncbi:unnamed protein product [Caenorhabditis nigoni]
MTSPPSRGKASIVLDGYGSFHSSRTLSLLKGSQLSCSNCLQELLSGGEIIVLVVASGTLRLMHSRSQRLFQGDCCGSEDDVRSTALTNSGDVDFGSFGF